VRSFGSHEVRILPFFICLPRLPAYFVVHVTLPVISPHVRSMHYENAAQHHTHHYIFKACVYCCMSTQVLPSFQAVRFFFMATRPLPKKGVGAPAATIETQAKTNEKPIPHSTFDGIKSNEGSGLFATAGKIDHPVNNPQNLESISKRLLPPT
jgi:hypothetical protein